ncbi:DUF4225 domain-containing protein [Pantoea sp. BAV 3049]|uniref:DUF4225 domain-containing protein n=1 Tax=Pantoea sp. BAV 3049 TaxID=2654188 RepID=UPI00131D5A22|nr:DUF4225 domain-containing protein [Pantoea sp. BAV 3049]
MDNYLAKDRFSDYFLTMANLEARQLSATARTVSSMHLTDLITRMRFMDEVQRFISSQIQTIRSAKNDAVCQECLNNLRQERHFLGVQNEMLSTGRAAVSASVKFYHDNEKIIGYVIDGIGVILGGLQIVAGAGVMAASLATGNVIGTVVGVHLILNGTSTLVEKISKLEGNKDAVGFMKNAYMDSAEFFGFDRKLGMLAYQGVDLGTSYYGILKLSLKPKAWRLFHYIPSDYFRKISSMSRPALAIKGVSAAGKIGQMGLTYKDIKQEK